ncbi:MAG TPA: transglycosylase domain-containing protein [Thermohalobaculum sp.]|nr:transglycosylase domain-containing protein [Thermohalobaculum sp.]
MTGEKEQATPKKKRAKRSKREERKPGLIARAIGFLVRAVVRIVWAIGWRAGVICGAILAVATGYYYLQLPPVEELFDGRGGGSVTMLDRHGNVFAWRGEQYGGDLGINEVSPHLIHAVIATEDRRYYDHFGIDPLGITRAMIANIRAGRLVQGGSTLTQQVAKNVFLTAERSLERKIKELPMALALELKYTKEQILSIYLNRVYLGAGTYGFEAASQRYFGKSARLLSPAEAAMLAGLLRAPSRYAPTNDLGRSQGRAGVIVRLMEEQGYLSETQVVQALANPAELSPAAAARAGGYFADWVMEQAPDYLAKDTTEDVTIITTFDADLQRAADEAVAAVFDAKVKDSSVAQAAVVVMTPDGEVRAMVGGREHGVGQFNRATHAKRQTGSAFKPIVYAAALEAGMRPMDVVVDQPLRIGDWTPENYDRKYRGAVTLADALANSINTVAVRVSERAGQDRVRQMAERMGLTTPLAPGPAIALGTSEATLVDMTGVFATIANRGRAANVRGIREIRLRGDNTALLRQRQGPGEQVMSDRSAGQLTWMLREVIERGTGRRARLPDRDAAGKTGTTQAARDAWFIGFTADYVVGVWMGNDDNSPLTGVAGGGLPAEIWRETMIRLNRGMPPSPLPTAEPGGQSTLLAGDGRQRGERRGNVVERVFFDVLRSLTGGGGGGGRNSDFKPQRAEDR